ncbi:hypothetical protein KEM54_002261 [Ascosphaera aggregata]|nr:hypothetical protein KEM54_002261 [Ascosphaera aggregata]
MSIKTRNWLTRVKTRLSRTSSLVSQTNSVRQESGFRLTPKPTDLSLSSNAHDTVFVNQHGDFLPVSIGDSLQKDRYVIAKKIGSGRESTVWLAKDHLNAHNIVVDFAGRQSNLKKLMARRTYGRLSFQAGGIPKTQEVPTPRVSDMNEAIVKIIDFENGELSRPHCSCIHPTDYVTDGSIACPVKQHKMKTIQAPMLRAPEVWVGAPWGTAVDIWSLGCLSQIIEWAQGFAPFAIEKRGGDKYLANGDEYLAKMVKILGRFPQSLLDQRDGINDHFDDELMERIPDVRPGSLPIKALVDGSTGNFRRPDDMTHLETSQFISFLRKMLQLDPKGRRSAASLLQDPWLKYHT